MVSKLYRSHIYIMCQFSKSKNKYLNHLNINLYNEFFLLFTYPLTLKKAQDAVTIRLRKRNSFNKA
jgi:hypothetical protein